MRIKSAAFAAARAVVSEWGAVSIEGLPQNWSTTDAISDTLSTRKEEVR